MGLTPNGIKLSVVYDKSPLHGEVRGAGRVEGRDRATVGLLWCFRRTNAILFSRGRALRKLNGKQEAENRPPTCAAPATVNVLSFKRFDVSPIPAKAGGPLATTNGLLM